jgi:hypothetical protein
MSRVLLIEHRLPLVKYIARRVSVKSVMAERPLDDDISQSEDELGQRTSSMDFASNLNSANSTLDPPTIAAAMAPPRSSAIPMPRIKPAKPPNPKPNTPAVLDTPLPETSAANSKRKGSSIGSDSGQAPLAAETSPTPAPEGQSVGRISALSKQLEGKFAAAPSSGPPSANSAAAKKKFVPIMPMPVAQSPMIPQSGTAISPVNEDVEELKVGSLDSQSSVFVSGSVSKKTAGRSGRKKFGGLRESLRNVFGRNDDGDNEDTAATDQSAGRRTSVDANAHQTEEENDDLQKSPSMGDLENDPSSDDLSFLAWDKRNNVYSSIVNEMALRLQQRRNIVDGAAPSPSAGGAPSRFTQAEMPPALDGSSENKDSLSVETKDTLSVEMSPDKAGSKRRPVFVPYITPETSPLGSSSSSIPSEDKAPAPTPEKLRGDGVERLQSALEIWSTEETYVTQLELVFNDVVRWLKGYAVVGPKPLIKEQEIQVLFGSIGELLTLHRKILAKLRELKENGDEFLERNVGDVFIKFAPYFKLYFNHVNTFAQNQQKLKVERKKNPDLDRFLQVFEYLAKQTVESFLITPVQRIPRYKLLLERIKKHCRYLTSEEDQSYVKQIEMGLTKVEEIAAQLEDMMEMSEAREKVVQIQEKVFKGKVALVSPRRYCVRIGALAKIHESKSGSNSQKKYLFVLFNDLLIYSTIPDKARSAQLRAEIPLEDIGLENIPDDDNQQYAFKIVSAKRAMVIIASNQKEKDDWLADLRNSVGQALSNADSKSKLVSQGSMSNLNSMPSPSSDGASA